MNEMVSALDSRKALGPKICEGCGAKYWNTKLVKPSQWKARTHCSSSCPARTKPRQTMWDDKRTARLVKLIESGLSSPQIAKALGCSKGSVVGKAHRIGIPVGRSRNCTVRRPRRKALARPQFSGTHVEPQGVSLAPVNACRADILPALDLPAYEPPAPEDRLSILHVSNKTCRFPLDDGPDYSFCGDTPEPGKPYCAHHCAVAYRPIVEKERAA